MVRRWELPAYDGIDALELAEGDLAAPEAGEVAIRVTAIGVNPSDAKSLAGGWNADPSKLPLPVGQEAAGVITAVGPDTAIASGPVRVGDRVVAFKIAGAFADAVVVPAKDVFAIPAGLDDHTAAGILHVGVVAAELLALAGATAGDTLLVHGASGSVGVLAVQLARRAGIRVIGTASEANQDKVRAFGADAVVYGDGLADRVRALAPDGVQAAIDAAGTPEALAVSLELVGDPSRVATLAPGKPAQEAGVKISAGMRPESIAFREPERAVILALAAERSLTLPIAATFDLTQAKDALRLVATGHPGGKVVLTA
ncbi:NADP-dependent oxidoreductase [Microbacterium thalassium]|uniref:NADPH:quinone reductase-like Zn-dependent oxidoreductase n=1 Tax=Microbacterium thalassium TaxID=362649 RepID=A0A7X0KTC7_9MICO|nr:NADP-dependent oxidoreductase [Microbacterium thalassium]MBB6389942.1 NADPH:quinone reductase-like Zn-dependent oxidoreductase [Microbacterium thalassium]GLK24628.1 oxidoreductase [Microbacterium thalassium]